MLFLEPLQVSLKLQPTTKEVTELMRHIGGEDEVISFEEFSEVGVGHDLRHI